VLHSISSVWRYVRRRPGGSGEPPEPLVSGAMCRTRPRQAKRQRGRTVSQKSHGVGVGPNRVGQVQALVQASDIGIESLCMI
jgi:hypothetical protein